jgi:hypothetical protein
VADPWITLAAIATAIERIRLGPMVTPLARRRPVKVARETATLDLLSGGRITLGVGLGSDRFGNEFSITGEELDERRRARMLDESLGILTAAWSGEPVQHRGTTTRSTACDSFPGRPCRSESRGSTASPGRCAGPPGSRASCLSTSNAPASSRRSWPTSPRCAKRQAPLACSPTTSSPPCHPAASARALAALIEADAMTQAADQMHTAAEMARDDTMPVLLGAAQSFGEKAQSLAWALQRFDESASRLSSSLDSWPER